MNSKTKSNIEVSDVFNTFTYLDDAVSGDRYEGQTLGTIAKDLETRMKAGEFNGDQYKDLRQCIQYINDAVSQNKSWGKAVLLDTSSTNNTGAWKDDLIQGATFKMDGDYFVAFRGTGDGRWTDNAKGMTLPTTKMQQEAADYFDEVAERYHFEEEKANGAHIYDGGHSKGGNEAQFVVFGSKYGYLIDECYSMDGQGQSPEAIAAFKAKYGEEYYNRRLKDMYSICGENDPVHQLGIRIIPDENTYYIHVTSEGILPWHDLKYMSGYQDKDGNWHYDGLHWFRDENGNIINGTPSYGALLGQNISRELMNLPEDKRNAVAVAIMKFIDWATGSCLAYEDEKVDWVNFIGYGLPILEKELFLTPEGQRTLLHLFGMAVDAYVDKFGLWGGAAVAVIAAGVLTLAAPLVFAAIKAVVGLVVVVNIISAAIRFFDAAMDFLGKYIDGLKDIAKGVKEAINNFINAVGKVIGKLGELIRSLDPDVRFANDNPHFIIDTVKLRGYGNDLNRINKAIASIDSRMDSLYTKVGLLDLWNLMQADILTSYNRHIEKAAAYCIDTAARFEEAENTINMQW